MSCSRRSVLVGALSLGWVTCAGAQGAQPGPVIETRQGKVRGRSAGGISAFRGIPYAAPAGGANRFLPPQPALPWTGVRDSGDFAAQAPQLRDESTGGSALPMPPMSEDCLFLNVYTRGPGASPKPVMVWMHGGGWRVGSGNVDGANLARMGDVVVVSLNHRLGLFGHLWLDDKDDRFADSANVGVLDLVAALQWVRDNVAAFGGDPGNVTIFGQSGGGSKVSALMAVPAAKGLFHKVIAESCSGTLRVTGQEEAAARAHVVARQLGLAEATGESFQKLPTSAILAAIAATTPKVNAFRPVLDGRTFTRHPFDPDAPAQSAGIPFMAGNMATETTAELAHDRNNFFLSDEEVRRRLVRYLGVDAAEVHRIMAAYRATSSAATPSDLLAMVTTDYQYMRNTQREAQLQSASGRAPVYYYVFDWRLPTMDGLLKSPHAGEVQFVFGNGVASGRLQGADPAEVAALNRMMTATWSTFARTGNPDNPAIPHWPRYDDKTRSTMMLDVRSRVERDPGGKARASLGSLPYYEYNMPINFDEP